MLIIHGDDTTKSYQFLSQQTAPEIIRLDLKNADITILRQTLDSSGLFPQDRLIIITSLFASKNKNVITLLSGHQTDSIIIYESKALTPTQLKHFSQSKIQEFKPTALIFKFLESLSPSNTSNSKQFQQIIDSGEPAELVFAMLCRQIRMLIQALSPNKLKLPPWQKTKLITQAKVFGKEKLLNFHHQLYLLDKGVKTGKNPIDLETRLFSLLLNI